MKACSESNCPECTPRDVSTTERDGAPQTGFLDLAKRRYSVRKYLGRKVEQEKIASILEAGRVAPTAANFQPVSVIVVRSDEGLAKLGRGAKVYGAPVAFIVCANRDIAWKRPFDGKSMTDIDATIVTDHMMFEATDRGLGTLWMTYFDPAVIRGEFGIPDNLEPVNILLAGYSADIAASPDRHERTRKGMSEMIVDERF